MVAQVVAVMSNGRRSVHPVVAVVADVRRKICGSRIVSRSSRSKFLFLSIFDETWLSYGQEKPDFVAMQLRD